MPPRLLLPAIAAFTLTLAPAAHADPAGVKAGILTCHVSSGWGLVFGSSKDLDCTLANGAASEDYQGKIKKFGVDVGYQRGGVMVWAVFAPTASLSPNALNGDYNGVTAGASAGVGANANVLVGGAEGAISLQPLSIEGTTGLNIAAGVAQISLVRQPD